MIKRKTTPYLYMVIYKEKTKRFRHKKKVDRINLWKK
jgi:hypothetical protein